MIISGGEKVTAPRSRTRSLAIRPWSTWPCTDVPTSMWATCPWPPSRSAPGAELTVEALGQWLTARLARYRSNSVVLDELPRNASGKSVKGLLREQDPA